jgi:hypothetical protein
MRLNNQLLQLLSHEILHGNPFWGLVVANEYLSPGEPFHTALIRCFQERVGAASSSPLAQLLTRGACFSELPKDLANEVGPRKTTAPMRHIPPRTRPFPRSIRCGMRRPIIRAPRFAPRSPSKAESPRLGARERAPRAAHTVSLIR